MQPEDPSKQALRQLIGKLDDEVCTRWPSPACLARITRGERTVLPLVDVDGHSTERQIVIGCHGLLPVSLLPTLIGIAGWVLDARTAAEARVDED